MLTFMERLDSLVGEQFLRDEGKTLCRICGYEAVVARCSLSVHTTLFEICSGGGDVKVVPVPWCRTCEGPPPATVYGCIHDDSI